MKNCKDCKKVEAKKEGFMNEFVTSIEYMGTIFIAFVASAPIVVGALFLAAEQPFVKLNGLAIYVVGLAVVMCAGYNIRDLEERIKVNKMNKSHS